jgi:acetylornithine/LysW-gamma-L-lysine aminotransferase
MIGIELKERVKPYLLELMDRGVLALPAGPKVIRLLPPLTTSQAQLDRVAHILAQVLSDSDGGTCR